MNKKEIRKHFRDVCFKRDKYTCVMCGRKSSPESVLDDMDCHHIVSRSQMPHQGYVKENGITLCKDSCHLKAEEFYSIGATEPGFSPDDLFMRINSSKELALAASLALTINKN